MPKRENVYPISLSSSEKDLYIHLSQPWSRSSSSSILLFVWTESIFEKHVFSANLIHYKHIEKNKKIKKYLNLKMTSQNQGPKSKSHLSYFPKTNFIFCFFIETKFIFCLHFLLDLFKPLFSSNSLWRSHEERERERELTIEITEERMAIFELQKYLHE